MYLSLPLPIKKKSKTSIVYVPYDPSQQLQRMVVTLSKEASIAHLQKEVAKMMSVEDPNSVSYSVHCMLFFNSLFWFVAVGS